MHWRFPLPRLPDAFSTKLNFSFTSSSVIEQVKILENNVQAPGFSCATWADFQSFCNGCAIIHSLYWRCMETFQIRTAFTKQNFQVILTWLCLQAMPATRQDVLGYKIETDKTDFTLTSPPSQRITHTTYYTQSMKPALVQKLCQICPFFR